MKKIKRATATMIVASLLLISGQDALWAVMVPAGTPVIVKVLQELSSQTNSNGEIVSLAVANDVSVGGLVVIKQGTAVLGQITKATKAGSVGSAGELILTAQFVPAIDGATIPINLTKNAQGDSKMGTSLVLTLICCILFLLKKGDNVTIPANTMLTALTLASIEVKGVAAAPTAPAPPEQFPLPPVPAPTAPAPTTPAPTVPTPQAPSTTPK